MASVASSRVSSCCCCSSSFATVLQQPYLNRSNHGAVAPPVQRREKFSAGKCRMSLRSRRPSGGGGTGIVRMGLRAVESYDASFQLVPECEKELLGLLKSDTFCSQVAEQAAKGPGAKYTFTGEIFQPVPWSPATKHGMPQEYEKYLEDKEQYSIINVPPNFMFQAKIFKPSRLCAVYQRVNKD